VIKWSLTAAVVVLVGWQAWQLWHQDDIQRVEWNLGWLALAGVVYVVAWLPSLWFWRRLLHAFGGRVRYADAARAFYCGHLGKYVPGKATVLVIRAGLIKDRGSRPGAAALAATYETLLMVAVGAAVAVALSPLLLTEELIARFPSIPYLDGAIGLLQQTNDRAPYLPAAVVLVIVLCGMPLTSRVLSSISTRLTPQDLRAAGLEVRIGTRLLIAGTVAFLICWAMQGLCLGLVLRGVSPGPFDLADWPVWTAGIALATVSGFVVLFAPGGIGVREGLLIGVLENQPGVGAQQAVAAALLLRLVFLAAEITVSATLYYMVRARDVPSAG